MTEDTYTIEVTGKQAHTLAVWISMLAQDVMGEEGGRREEVKALAPVGKQCAAIAEEAGEWEGER